MPRNLTPPRRRRNTPGAIRSKKHGVPPNSNAFPWLGGLVTNHSWLWDGFKVALGWL